MAQFALTVKLKENSDRPVVEARYKGELKYSLPNKPGIEAALCRLQTDIIRDAATRRGDRNLAIDEGEGDSAAPNDTGPLSTTVQEIGNVLFQYLFYGDIQTLYREAVTDAREKNDVLHVSLVFPSDQTNPLQIAPWLNLTPWETLWDDTNREFLATAGSTYFSRAVGDLLNSTPRLPPLRILEADRK
jgi:hypothetical protein